MNEREEFERLLSASRESGDDSQLRAWWGDRYSPSAFAMLQCALSCGTMEKWRRITVPTEHGEHYVGRYNRERNLLEVKYRGNTNVVDLSK